MTTDGGGEGPESRCRHGLNFLGRHEVAGLIMHLAACQRRYKDVGQHQFGLGTLQVGVMVIERANDARSYDKDLIRLGILDRARS